MLDINNYLSLEKKAYTELPNRFIEAFRPIVFQEIGYPVNITKEEECKKYIDVMHERRFERYHSLFGGLTESEFVLYKKAIQHVGEFCERNYNSRVLPKASMLNALNGYTQLRRLFSNEASNDGPVTIFELGGGSGYQGLLTFLGGG
ncbi:MAG: hypothetical protein LBG04_01840 [Holosporaceae bacterium]|jgi:uncharacterized metal-binding protein|nr:hypothetical protein [Holosporaceae bacterium]